MARDSGNLLIRILHHSATAWVILLASMVLTGVAWFISNQFVLQRAVDRFRFETSDVKSAIGKRMLEYEAILRGGAGLFAASGEVDREMWRTYVTAIEIDRYFPGIQGIGHSMVIRPEEKAAHVVAVRAEGFPDYTIRPEGERELYTSIVYLEPFVKRNLRAFGYDMFSEPVRRAAMERARDSGEMSLSGMVTLVQETTMFVQKGFLMYLPLYRKGLPVESVEQRRAAWLGFVYSPFRIEDLMRGILGAGTADIGFEIFDGDRPSPETRLYSSDEPSPFEPGSRPYRPDFSLTEPMPMGGHAWTLHLYSRPGYISAGDAGQPLIVAFGGLLVDLLLFFIIGSISRQQKQAEALAREMTAELVASKEVLERSNAELRRFAYVASHDLQEPLRMVASYVELLRRRYQGRLDADADAFIGFAVDGTARMKALIKDLLEFSRIDGEEGTPVATDTNEIVRTVLSALAARSEEAGAAITLGELPVVVADGRQLASVFHNLVDNGIKFRHPGRKPEIGIGAERSGDDWVFTVADNGIGIEPEHLERIFVVFRKLQARHRVPGTGMGLAICRKIVERHGGRIRAESRPGEGSTFFFSLPGRPEPPAPVREEPQP